MPVSAPEILPALQNLRSVRNLRLLFQKLNYSPAFEEIPLESLGETKAVQSLRSLVRGEIQILAQAADAGFNVFYIPLAEMSGNAAALSLSAERLAVTLLLRAYSANPYALFVFSSADDAHWHFVNVKEGGRITENERGARSVRRVLRRLAVGPNERLRTASQKIASLDVSVVAPNLFGVAPLALQRQHDLAFDVEKATGAFFRDLVKIFDGIRAPLAQEQKDAAWAHEWSLQLLNRLMFLYFVARKRWLGDDIEFMLSFWQEYKKHSEKTGVQDEFYSKWLCPLFFKAFNKEFNPGLHPYFPPDIRTILIGAPYLNGGLFRANAIDSKLESTVPDAIFARLFDEWNGERPGFLERYNFTIAEDTPFDQEVAVDPEMMGKVFESLVNVSDAVGDEGGEAAGALVAHVDERGERGIFYTPRVEIDLMCRLTLAQWAAGKLAAQKSETPRVEWKRALHQLLFALEPSEKESADAHFDALDGWKTFAELLKNLTMCDPACGSGAFLVGMLQVLDDLQRRAGDQLEWQETDYQRRKRIIGTSLYGVDVMPWAVHVAELRLWLQLIVDSDDARAEEAPKVPLLPNLSFKIRHGDSLVQYLGDINLSGQAGRCALSSGLRTLRDSLRSDKSHFFFGQAKSGVDENSLRRRELQLFGDILMERRIALQNQAVELGKLFVIQKNALGEEADQFKSPKERKRAQDDLKAIEADSLALETAKARLSGGQVPFVWDMAFVEIFAGAKSGFDLVLGNPPYVRNEKIADPAGAVTPTVYKERLQASARAAYPHFLKSRKLDGKSDLYIYFFLLGQKLLAPDGAFAFITSNSWLDVGYGKDLQEFLLEYGHAPLIFDNEAKRSFASADVNTAITVLSAPQETPQPMESARDTRFVMWRVPFESSFSPILWDEIDESSGRKTYAEFRVCPLSSRELLEEGSEKTDKGGEKYTGNKWGGKYLRAPEIYFTLLEKGRDKLVRLGDVADVKFGIKTGANEFFYLDAERAQELEIEPEFLRPVIKSPRDYYGISIKSGDTLMFWCRQEKSELKGTAALKYIQAGEKQGFHEIASCKTRRLWYSLNGPEKPILLWPSAFFERHVVYECPKKYVADKVFYTISGDIPVGVRAFLNSTLVSLMVEVEGYQLNHGGIFVTTEWLNNLPILNVEDEELIGYYNALKKRDIRLCREELKQPDRANLDKRVVELLGFKGKSADEALQKLHEAVREYVSGRIHKSGRNITQSDDEPINTVKADKALTRLKTLLD